MERRNEKHWKKSEKGKAKDIFPFLYGGVPLRVSILKENTKETYIRFLLFFTSYLAGRCLLSSAKGASLRCWKKRGCQENVRKQARVFERTIAGETHTARRAYVRY